MLVAFWGAVAGSPKMLVAFWGAVVVTPTAGIKRTGEFNALCEGYKNIYKSKVNL